jgi:hypothetical protein
VNSKWVVSTFAGSWEQHADHLVSELVEMMPLKPKIEMTVPKRKNTIANFRSMD